jgi:hypothetical protein
MNIVRNEKLIKRNSRIAQVTMLASLLILAGGMFISFRYPEQFGVSLAALMLGFLLSQLGIYFTNRWGRRPRPDELLDQSLKGLDKKYTLFHYASPASHLLVGPAGVWVLLPYHQAGTISYSNGRWRQKGGNIYLKIFAQENLGRPDLEVLAEVERMQKHLAKHLAEDVVPPIQVALVFTNQKAQVNISEDETPPAETVPANKLKDTIRKAAKAKSLSLEKAQVIQDAIAAG